MSFLVDRISVNGKFLDTAKLEDVFVNYNQKILLQRLAGNEFNTKARKR